MAIASFQAGESLSAGDAVYVASDNLLYKASGLNTTQASVAGLAIDSGSAGDLIRINADSLYDGLSGLTPGELQFLSITTSGSVVDYPTWASEFSSFAADAYLTKIGRATTSTDLEVNISTPTLVVYTP
jgi:hypothetical protein